MNRIKLPYGISDFKSLREQGYWYADKTRYIEQLEGLNSKYLLFVRPRRFGKSLFLSMLQHYYDVREQDRFDALFGSLYIGSRPTLLRNRYLMLKLNFSALNTAGRQELESSFTEVFRDEARSFFQKYDAVFADSADLVNQLEGKRSLRSMWDLLFNAVQKTDYKIYLIIDEYDHFANDIIAVGDSQFYKDVVRATGFVRDFYEAVKIGTEHSIDRIFMTGVSPIMLDDMTSGFNISTNLTMSPLVNEMLGFTEADVGAIIAQAGLDTDRKALIEDLRKNYNGYLFHKNGRSSMYNPDMILHFFNEWQMTGQYPEKLIDENVKTDYARIRRLVAHEHNRGMLDEIIHNEQITADIVPKFSFDRMYDEQYFVSLLFYMGLLTIDRAEKMRLLLKIPNFVIKVMFWEHIEQELRREYRKKENRWCQVINKEQPGYNLQSYPVRDIIRAFMEGRLGGESGMIIRGIHHVQICIPIGKEKEAEAFYCGILGLEPLKKPDSLLGRGGFWLQVGDREVHIATEDGIDRNKTKAHIAYEVENIDVLKAILKANNIEPVDSIPIPGRERFEIRDPFGNRIEFLSYGKGE